MENRYCEKCGRLLDRDDINYCRLCYEDITGVNFYTQKKVERKEYTQENEKFNNNRNEKEHTENQVAKKFTLVVTIIKTLGYIGACIIGVMLFMFNDNFLIGLFAAGVIIIATWLSTLIFEAIAEGLNLLQDIKNKL